MTGGAHHGRRVVVTAGADGIGKSIAALLHEEGASVCIADVNEQQLGECQAQFPGMICRRADVADVSDVDAVFDKLLGEWGGVDALVNNVGIAGPTAPVEEVTAEDWERVMRVNIGAHFLCTRRAVPAMKSGGSIVNISSTAGVMGYPLRAPYAASKWAVVGLTQTLAMELGERRIRVNAVCPGSVDGARMARVIAAESAARGIAEQNLRRAYERQASMRTFVDAGDIANAVSFLISDRARLVSGQVLCVDGNTETRTL